MKLIVVGLPKAKDYLSRIVSKWKNLAIEPKTIRSNIAAKYRLLCIRKCCLEEGVSCMGFLTHDNMQYAAVAG